MRIVTRHEDLDKDEQILVFVGQMQDLAKILKPLWKPAPPPLSKRVSQWLVRVKLAAKRYLSETDQQRQTRVRRSETEKLRREAISQAYSSWRQNKE